MSEDSVEKLKKELEFYKKKLSLAEHDVALDGYAAYVNIVRQQVDYIKEFNIKNNIDGKKSESAMYDRTEAIWKNLPDMISKMNSLKDELKIEFDDKEGQPKIKAVSPQSIGL